MPEMMDLQFVNQRHEDILHEAGSRRRAKALRATRRRHDGHMSALVWEMKSHAGVLLKPLKRKVG
jgi:hypothetical protein